MYLSITSIIIGVVIGYIGAVVICAFAFHKLMKSADDQETSLIKGVDDEQDI